MHWNSDRRSIRTELEFDRLSDGEIESVTLPFVTLVVADLTPEITRDRLTAIQAVGSGENVLEQLAPQLTVQFPDLSGEKSAEAVRLTFREWCDFTPASIGENIPSIRGQIQTRRGLHLLRRLTLEDEIFNAELCAAAASGELQEFLQPNCNADSGRSNEVDAHRIFHRCSSIETEMVLTAVRSETCRQDIGNLSRIYQDDASLMLNALMEDIDRQISRRLHSVILSPEYIALSSAWLGLKYLCEQSADLAGIRIKVLSCDSGRLGVAIDSGEFLTFLRTESVPGEHAPVSLIAADLNVDSGSLNLIDGLTQSAREVLAPVVVNASPGLFGLNDWACPSLPMHLAQWQSDPSGVAWRRFAATEQAQFLALGCSEFHPTTQFTSSEQRTHLNYAAPKSVIACGWVQPCWGLAARIHMSACEFGLPYRAEGANHGALPASSPAVLSTDEGHVGYSTLRNRFSGPDLRALVDCGITPLFEDPGTLNGAVFFMPSVYLSEQTARRRLFLETLCASRFIHHLTALIMTGPEIGSAGGVADLAGHYLANYVLDDQFASEAMKARYPLRESSVNLIGKGDGQTGQLSVTLMFNHMVLAAPPYSSDSWDTRAFSHCLFTFSVEKYVDEELRTVVENCDVSSVSNSAGGDD